MDATERSDTFSREAGVFEADAGFASPFGRIFLLHKSLLSEEITDSEVTRQRRRLRAHGRAIGKSVEFSLRVECRGFLGYKVVLKTVNSGDMNAFS